MRQMNYTIIQDLTQRGPMKQLPGFVNNIFFFFETQLHSQTTVYSLLHYNSKVESCERDRMVYSLKLCNLAL